MGQACLLDNLLTKYIYFIVNSRSSQKKKKKAKVELTDRENWYVIAQR